MTKILKRHMAAMGLLILCLTCPAKVQTEGMDIIIQTSVDRSEVTVGDPILYTLTIRYRKDIKPALPGWGVNLGQFEIQDYALT